MQNIRTLEGTIKHFVSTFVRQGHFEDYIGTWFALILCYVLRHSSQICGKMTEDLLAKRKHLNEIAGSFCIRLK